MCTGRIDSRMTRPALGQNNLIIFECCLIILRLLWNYQSNNLILVTKHYMGDLTQGFDGICFERPARSKCQRAQQVSARAASVSARSKCQRAQQVSARAASVSARSKCQRAQQVSARAASVSARSKCQRAQQVSARAASVSARSKCQRAARARARALRASGALGL